MQKVYARPGLETRRTRTKRNEDVTFAYVFVFFLQKANCSMSVGLVDPPKIAIWPRFLTIIISIAIRQCAA